MPEKYKPSEPSAEEMLQAEENMTKKQKEKSIDREDTYKAGREHGRDEIVNRIEGIKETLDSGLLSSDFTKRFREGVDLVDSSIKIKIEKDKYFEEIKDFAINCGLSKNAEEVLIRKEVTYVIGTGRLKINDVINKEILQELIDKLPVISEYYVGVRIRSVANEDILERIRERFPKAKIDLPDRFIS